MTKDRLYQIIVDVYRDMNREFPLKNEEISLDAELTALGIDSLSFVMIMLKIEETFGISLSVEGLTACRTVQDIVNAVEGAEKKK